MWVLHMVCAHGAIGRYQLGHILGDVPPAGARADPQARAAPAPPRLKASAVGKYFHGAGRRRRRAPRPQVAPGRWIWTCSLRRGGATGPRCPCGLVPSDSDDERDAGRSAGRDDERDAERDGVAVAAAVPRRWMADRATTRRCVPPRRALPVQRDNPSDAGIHLLETTNSAGARECEQQRTSDVSTTPQPASRARPAPCRAPRTRSSAPTRQALGVHLLALVLAGRVAHVATIAAAAASRAPSRTCRRGSAARPHSAPDQMPQTTHVEHRFPDVAVSNGVVQPRGWRPRPRSCAGPRPSRSGGARAAATRRLAGRRGDAERRVPVVGGRLAEGAAARGAGGAASARAEAGAPASLAAARRRVAASPRATARLPPPRRPPAAPRRARRRARSHSALDLCHA